MFGTAAQCGATEYRITCNSLPEQTWPINKKMGSSSSSKPVDCSEPVKQAADKATHEAVAKAKVDTDAQLKALRTTLEDRRGPACLPPRVRDPGGGPGKTVAATTRGGLATAGEHGRRARRGSAGIQTGAGAYAGGACFGPYGAGTVARTRATMRRGPVAGTNV